METSRKLKGERMRKSECSGEKERLRFGKFDVDNEGNRGRQSETVMERVAFW